LIDMLTRLLSSDTHIIEPPNLWIDRIHPAYRDRAPHAERVGDAEWWIVEGHRTLSFAGGAQTGDRFEKPLELRTGARFEEVRPGGYIPEEHLRDSERDGVMGSVLYPTEGLQLYQIHDSRLFAAVCRAYNDWLAEFCRVAPARLKGIAMLPLDDVEEGIAEMQRTRELGLSGALIPTAQRPDARYDNPMYESLWSAAEDLDVPLSLHLGANRTPFEEDIKTIRPSYFTVVDFWVKTSVADMIFSGVFDRHPGLRIGCIEHELGWIPHFLDRLDYTYTQRQGNRSYYRMRNAELPSDFFRNQVFCSFQDDELGIRERHVIGIRGLTWGSDYPHTESTFPYSREIMSRRLKDVPEEEQEMIAFGNLSRLYQFDG
jgi:predicted TIM-barrel fold metal-dependent hydrolase